MSDRDSARLKSAAIALPRLKSVAAHAIRAAALIAAAALSSPSDSLSAGRGETAAGLPIGSRIDQPLRRLPSGEIEIVDPRKRAGRCSAGAICAGNGQRYLTLSEAVAAARPGTTIELMAGTYRESVAVRTRGVTIQGVGGTPHVDCTGLSLSGNKACILLAADGVTLENLHINGAELRESDGANGACIRNQNNRNFTLRRVVCNGSQNGLLANGGDIVIENSEFYDNGWTSLTHNAYLGGKCTVVVRGSIFRDARVGHEFKSRCARIEISDSTFRSTHGSRNLDIPNGGETMVYRSTLVKTAGAESEEIIGFGAEGCAHSGNMVLKDVTITNSRRNAVIHNFDKCRGQAIVLQDVRTEGTPFREIGYILSR